jgi:archaellum component FlaC
MESTKMDTIQKIEELEAKIARLKEIFENDQQDHWQMMSDICHELHIIKKKVKF